MQIEIENYDLIFVSNARRPHDAFFNWIWCWFYAFIRIEFRSIDLFFQLSPDLVSDNYQNIQAIKHQMKHGADAVKWGGEA